jgi:sortase A
MMRFFGTGLGRRGLYLLGIVALFAIGALALADTGMLSGADAQPAERAIQPIGVQEATPEPIAETAADTAEKTEPEDKTESEDKAEPEEKRDQIEQAVKEPTPVPDGSSASASTSASASPSASASSSTPAAAPADTTMYLSVPAMGISDIPVVEGITEASLSQGVGHMPDTGYPWVPGSNTYIAGHRIGYPGTPSDHVFWNLPNLVVGDQIYLTDTNGTNYTYAVSEILEVPINDMSVTAPTGSDTLSLQTCIEDYGDYWTPGPNWNVRYVVRANRV